MVCLFRTSITGGVDSGTVPWLGGSREGIGADAKRCTSGEIWPYIEAAIGLHVSEYAKISTSTANVIGEHRSINCRNK